MLYNPYDCDLVPLVDNFGSTYTNAGLGTAASANASAHVKGTPVSLISGASVTQDVYGIGIIFNNGTTAGVIRRFFADILIDPAGGTSWSVIIPNLYVNMASLISNGWRYYFPLYVKSGTSFGFQQQSTASSSTLRCSVQLFGKPKRMENLRFGTRIETFGVNTGTTSGAAHTPGTSALSTYTSIGTTSKDLWWWQWGGIGYNSVNFASGNTILADVACGDGTNMLTCINKILCYNTTAEAMAKDAFGLGSCYREIPGGTGVYVRSACTGTPETTPTTTVYGLGG